MKPTTRNVPILTLVSVASTVCLFGFESIRSWLKHAPETLDRGVFFTVALILAVTTPVLAIRKKL